MSWLISKALMEAYENSLSSPAPAEESSVATCSDGEPSAQLNVMLTPQQFWRNDKMMDCSKPSLFGLTLRPLTESRGAALLTWYREGFPARTPAIGESEFGFVPTVLTSEATGPGLHGNGSHNFRTWFRENSTEKRSPLHGEIMMLWPAGWANIGERLAMDKFQEWRQQHGACSPITEKEPA